MTTFESGTVADDDGASFVAVSMAAPIIEILQAPPDDEGPDMLRFQDGARAKTTACRPEG